MSAHPFAELVEQIAERERRSAPAEGDYFRAIIFAFVEMRAWELVSEQQ